VIIKTLN